MSVLTRRPMQGVKPLFVYQPTPGMDTVIVNWWTRMQADGDLPKMFGSQHQGLSGLFRLIGAPNVLLYDMGTDCRIWVAAWFEEVMNGAFMGLWVRRDKRSA